MEGTYMQIILPLLPWTPNKVQGSKQVPCSMQYTADVSCSQVAPTADFLTKNSSRNIQTVNSEYVLNSDWSNLQTCLFQTC